MRWFRGICRSPSTCVLTSRRGSRRGARPRPRVTRKARVVHRGSAQRRDDKHRGPYHYRAPVFPPPPTNVVHASPVYSTAITGKASTSLAVARLPRWAYDPAYNFCHQFSHPSPRRAASALCLAVKEACDAGSGKQDSRIANGAVAYAKGLRGQNVRSMIHRNFTEVT